LPSALPAGAPVFLSAVLPVPSLTCTINTAKAGNAEKAAQQSGGTFAEALQSELDARNSAVGFSKHAMKRIESRNIEILDSDMLQRL